MIVSRPAVSLERLTRLLCRRVPFRLEISFNEEEPGEPARRIPSVLAFTAAVVLAGDGMPLSAAPVDISSGSGGFIGTPNAGAFSNTFTFSISTPQAVKLMLASAVGGTQNIDFTSVLLRGPSGDLMAAEFTRDPFETWTLATPLLSPGNYAIVASGINSDAIATYAGTLALSPVDPKAPGNDVPEPGTAGLVIAGLGAALMILPTRRRIRRL